MFSLPRQREALAACQSGARVATSSLRRARQLAFHRPDVQIVDVRGNVGTRLSKLLHEDSWSAIVLAKAGLQRLGFRLENGQMEYESQGLFASDLVEILPAVGQGAIGLEISADRGPLSDLLSQINDPGTWFCTAVGAGVPAAPEGGCQTPIGIGAAFMGRSFTSRRLFLTGTEEQDPGQFSRYFKPPKPPPRRSWTKFMATAGNCILAGAVWVISG